MKIRAPWMLKVAGWGITQGARLWMRTVCSDWWFADPLVRPDHPEQAGPYIYAFWHENLTFPAYHHGRPDIHVLISQHADGQLITEVCRRFGFSVVRGSTTRGGIGAVRGMLRVGQHLAITPDGPRGPRRQVQPGLIYLAARTGFPVVPAGIGYDQPWRLKSWDRFALPRPFRRARCVCPLPIRVPPEADRDRERMEEYRQRVEATLLEATAAAERWAETGVWQCPWPQQERPRGADAA